jgi:hypothetical protein
LFATPVAVCALVFALFAALLPVLVRGHRLAADVLAAGVWAGGLYAAVLGVEKLAGPGVHARGAAAGAALAGCVAVVGGAARRRGRERGLAPDFVP